MDECRSRRCGPPKDRQLSWPACKQKQEGCDPGRDQRGGSERLGRTEMKITVDTNVLVSAVVRDDERQARTGAKLLKEAELIAVSL
jgi:hypothetical protein